jgi:large subunit ribosomal protein L15
MELHNLRPAAGSVKRNTKRIGRGQGSGKGGTSTKGHKGDKSRSGHYDKKGFEGGQMPLQRRLPKRGFKNINRVEYQGINLDRLQEFVSKHNLTDVTFENMCKLGLVSKNARVKILATGELTTKVNVTVHAYSAAAKTAVETLGGAANTL